MLFNSLDFWLFFLVVFVAYWRLPHRAQNWLLVLASYVFYGAWDWRFLGLIWLSTVVDYVAAGRIAAGTSPRTRRLWLLASVVVNLGALGCFKYLGFFTTQAVALGDALGLSISLPLLEVVLPVGISFYTFQTMSYTIDVYRGQLRPSRRFSEFALFVCFFPQLVAGPIERAGRLLPQVGRERTWSYRAGDVGLGLIALGLLMKVCIADNLAEVVNSLFQVTSAPASRSDAALGMYAFAFQIYGDFAGYSLIARGLAKLLGFNFIDNFRSPYLARDPSDFWRRWHISLSTWLRDYLYIPLGGGRGGSGWIARNLMLTMLLGGLWHGAGWRFVIWGAIHGLLLVAYRPVRRWHRERTSGSGAFLVRVAERLVLFHVVCLAWVFFRSETAAAAFTYLGALATGPIVSQQTGSLAWITLAYVTPVLLYDLARESAGGDDALLDNRPWLTIALVAACLIGLVLLVPETDSPFLYFQF